MPDPRETVESWARFRGVAAEAVQASRDSWMFSVRPEVGPGNHLLGFGTTEDGVWEDAMRRILRLEGLECPDDLRKFVELSLESVGKPKTGGNR